MTITNDFDLPEAFVRFAERRPYSHGEADIGVTTLNDSPRIRYLSRLHSEEIDEDVSDRVFALLGEAVHLLLETGAGEDDIVEERFFAKINSMTISGQVDLRTPIEGGWLLSDYKTCGAYAIKANPEGKPEWVNQLNVYGLLAYLNNIDVAGLEVVAIIRDWQRSTADRDENYPQHPVVRIPIEIWDQDIAMEYVEKRIDTHMNDEIPRCTPQEMWERPPVYAVHHYTKSGTMKKRATKLFDTPFLAEAYIFGDESKNNVIKRDSERVRCAGNYCGVAEFCSQWKQHTGG